MSKKSWKIDNVSADDMATWCELLRDDNPVHLDKETAEQLGFGGRRVNPGPANLAYAMNLMMSHPETSQFTKVAATFVGNVFEEDGVLAEHDEAIGDGADVSVRVVRQADGDEVLNVVFDVGEGEGQ